MNCPECDKIVYGESCVCGWKPSARRNTYSPLRFTPPTARGKEIAKACMIVINKALSPYGNRKQVVQNMRELEELFPGIGFEREANLLERGIR